MKIPASLTSSLRKTVYLSAAYFDKLLGRRTPPVSILCYHSVNQDTWKYTIDPAVMEAQFKWLSMHFEIISLSNVAEYLNGNFSLPGGKPAIAITFDDGYADVMKLKAICQKLAIQPTMFLIADTEHVNQDELATQRPFLTKSEILTLVKSGWEVGSHSLTHADFATLSVADMENEIGKSKQKLETDLGLPITWLAYPKGAYTTDVKKMAGKAGYNLAFSLDDTAITPQTDHYAVPRIGVDRSHSMSEFKILTSPSCSLIRKLLKAAGLDKLM